MTGHEHDALDELRAQLNTVHPSPEFASGVRRRVAAARTAGGAWTFAAWRWVVIAAALLVLAAGTIWRSGLSPAVPRDPGAATPPAVATNAPAVPEAAGPVLPSPVAATRPEVVRRRPTSRPSVPAPQPVSNVDGDGLPPVITNQPAILRGLWARPRSMSLVAESVTAEPVQTGEIVVAPILVPDIEVKWLADPAAPPGPAPIIRKFAAVQAERSGR